MTNKEWLFARPNIEIVRTFQGCPPGKTYSRQKCESSDCEECCANWLDDEHKEPLKPCPFCGNTEITIFDGIDDNPVSFCMGCYVCGARTAWFSTREEATKAWNRRTDNGHKKLSELRNAD